MSQKGKNHLKSAGPGGDVHRYNLPQLAALRQFLLAGDGVGGYVSSGVLRRVFRFGDMSTFAS